MKLDTGMDDGRCRFNGASYFSLLAWSSRFMLLDHEQKLVPLTRVFGKAYFRVMLFIPIFFLWEGVGSWWFYGSRSLGSANGAAVFFDSPAVFFWVLAGGSGVSAWLLLPWLKQVDIWRRLRSGCCPACDYALAGLRGQGVGRVVCPECGGVWESRGLEFRQGLPKCTGSRFPIWYRQIVLPISLLVIFAGSALIGGGNPVAALVLAGIPMAVLVMIK